MMGYWYGGFGGMALLGMLMMALVWIAVIALGVGTVRTLLSGPGRSDGVGERAAALALLTRRYDAGEITALEYEEARRAIGA